MSFGNPLLDDDLANDAPTAKNGARRIKETFKQSINQAIRQREQIINIVNRFGRAAIVAELAVGEPAQMLTAFNALTAYIEAVAPDVVLEDLPA